MTSNIFENDKDNNLGKLIKIEKYLIKALDHKISSFVPEKNKDNETITCARYSDKERLCIWCQAYMEAALAINEKYSIIIHVKLCEKK